MSRYLRYILRTLEPVRVTDRAVSQRGQTFALRYIPGSAIRGMVVSSLADDPDFEALKKSLLADSTVFAPAYLYADGHSLMPAPKGFYEDKTVQKGKKAVQNVTVDGGFDEGLKRAALGDACYMDGDTIHGYHVKTGSDMRILLNTNEKQDRTLFRQEAILPGQCFEGSIRLPSDEAAAEKIMALFAEGRDIYLGNARTAGLGRCRVLSCAEAAQPPHVPDFFDTTENDIYMVLLSDTVMADDQGECCGLDLNYLEKKLHVDHLKISHAAASVKTIYGYNRTWGTHLPQLPVYEAGSVFHLTFDGMIIHPPLMRLCDQGIGLRRNEGFGRVMFFKDWDQLKYKQIHESESLQPLPDAVDKQPMTSAEADTLKIAARGYYLDLIETAMERYVVDPKNKLKKGGVKNSQLGSVEARLLKYRYNPEEAVKDLGAYFIHVKDKEDRQRVQRERASLKGLAAQVMDIMEKPLAQTLFGQGMDLSGRLGLKAPGKVMGIPADQIFDEEDEARMKMKLLIMMIRFDRRKEVRA